MKWISVKDRKPRIDENVLATDGCLVTRVQYIERLKFNSTEKCSYWMFFSSGCGCCDTYLENVTHWMPLPELPSDNPR